MNTRVVLILLVGIKSLSLFGQGGVVSAPILETQMGTLIGTQAGMSSVQAAMGGVIASLEKAEAAYKIAKEKASWARNLNTVVRLADLLENVVCSSRNLDLKLGMVERNCMWDLSFSLSIVKIEMAADFLAVVMTDGVSMTADGRLQQINNAVDKFKEAQMELGTLNRTLDSYLRKQAKAAIDQENTAKLMLYNLRK